MGAKKKNELCGTTGQQTFKKILLKQYEAVIGYRLIKWNTRLAEGLVVVGCQVNFLCPLCSLSPHIHEAFEFLKAY